MSASISEGVNKKIDHLIFYSPNENVDPVFTSQIQEDFDVTKNACYHARIVRCFETKDAATSFMERQRAVLPTLYHNRRDNEVVVNALSETDMDDGCSLPVQVKGEVGGEDLELPMEQDDWYLPFEAEYGDVNLGVKEEEEEEYQYEYSDLPLPVKEEPLPLPIKEEKDLKSDKKDALNGNGSKIRNRRQIIVKCEDSNDSEDHSMSDDDVICLSEVVPAPISNIKVEPDFVWVPLTLPSVKTEDVDFAWLPSSSSEKLPVPNQIKIEHKEMSASSAATISTMVPLTAATTEVTAPSSSHGTNDKLTGYHAFISDTNGRLYTEVDRRLSTIQLNALTFWNSSTFRNNKKFDERFTHLFLVAFYSTEELASYDLFSGGIFNIIQDAYNIRVGNDDLRKNAFDKYVKSLCDKKKKEQK